MTDYIQNTLCNNTATQSTTLSPTDCTPYYSWDENRAEEICPSARADFHISKSYDVEVCDDATSLTKQANLEKSLANIFFMTCSSWCVYDYDTIIKNIQSDSELRWIYLETNVLEVGNWLDLLYFVYLGVRGSFFTCRKPMRSLDQGRSSQLP